MSAQHQALRHLRAEFTHDTMPNDTRGAQFGRFHKKIHADGKKERQARRKCVNIHTPRDGRTHIFAPICQRKAQLLYQIGPRLLHMIATDRD